MHTQDEVDRTLRQIEQMEGEYHALGEQNRQIARERIAAYRASVDDITQTKITGYHARWPQDLDTQNRLARMLESGDPAPPILKPLIVGVLILILSFVVGWIFTQGR